MNDDDQKVISVVDRLGTKKAFLLACSQSMIARREQS
jgi:hypothetical protein